MEFEQRWSCGFLAVTAVERSEPERRAAHALLVPPPVLWLVVELGHKAENWEREGVGSRCMWMETEG